MKFAKKYISPFLLTIVLTASSMQQPHAPNELRQNDYAYDESFSLQQAQQPITDAQANKELYSLSESVQEEDSEEEHEHFTLNNGLALLKKQGAQEAVAIFEKPSNAKIAQLSEREKKLVQELFSVYAMEDRGNYRIAQFKYKDPSMLPQNKEQARLMLFSPYIESNISSSSSQETLADTAESTEGLKKETLPHNSVAEKAFLKELKDKFARLSCSQREGLLGATKIKTDNGYCELEELKVGDTVACYDVKTNTPTSSKITYTGKRRLQNHIQITVNDDLIQVAPEHKFFVESTHTWVTAKEMQTDEALQKLVSPSIKCVREVHEPIDVVQITVDSKHNLYITEHNILVHNFLPLVLHSLSYTGPGIASVLQPPLMAFGGIVYVTKNFFQNKKPKKLKQKQELKSSSGSVQPPNQNKDKDPKKDRYSEDSKQAKITTKEATEAAKKIGFERINERTSAEAPIYRKGKLFISPDVDFHNGGFWKMARSLRDLESRDLRLGTYNIDLSIRIGD